MIKFCLLLLLMFCSITKPEKKIQNLSSLGNENSIEWNEFHVNNKESNNFNKNEIQRKIFENNKNTNYKDILKCNDIQPCLKKCNQVGYLYFPVLLGSILAKNNHKNMQLGPLGDMNGSKNCTEYCTKFSKENFICEKNNFFQ